MAVYGIDFYGKSKYGSAQATLLSVEPFLAEQVGYGRVLLSWNLPAGTKFKQIRLVRNSFGFAAHENDGDVLVNTPISSPVSEYDDFDLARGRFYYYTVFLATSDNPPLWTASFSYGVNDEVTYNGAIYRALKNNVNVLPTNSANWEPRAVAMQEWVRGGDIGVLTVADHGNTARMYDLVAPVFKEINVRDLSEEAKNSPLYKFIHIFGFHLDMMKTEYDKLLDLNDPRNVQYKYLYDLASQLGIPLETSLGPRLSRLRARHGAEILREKGTFLGLQNLVNVSTGWDAEITIGDNLMLNGDQASFDNPKYEQWVATENYPAGVRVYYLGYVYESKVGGAYGLAQAPSGSNTSNTWWTVLAYNTQTGAASPMYNPLTGGISTWEVFRSDNGVAMPANQVVLGALHPTVVGDNTDNYLKVANNTGATVDVVARSVARVSGASALDKGQIIGDAVPIERPPTWQPGLEVAAGGRVLHNGIRYKALIDNPTVAPSGKYYSTSAWQVYEDNGDNSYTDAYIASFYTVMQETAGTAATVGAFLSWFSEDGVRLNSANVIADSAFVPRLDTFNYPALGGPNHYRDQVTGFNYVMNPSFEVDLAGWSPWGTGTLSERVNTFAQFGTWSHKVTTPGTTSLEGTVIGVAFPTKPVDPLIASAYLRGNVGGETVDMCVRVNYTDSTFEEGPVTSVVMTTSFQRFSAQFSVNPNKTTSSVQVFWRTPTAAAIVFFIDGAMLENSTALSAYIDGAQSGCRWTGTAHASTSERFVVLNPGKVAPFDLNDTVVPLNGEPTVWGLSWTYTAPYKKLGGVIYPATSLATKTPRIAHVNASDANHTVYATLRSSPPGGSGASIQGIVVRRNAASANLNADYWRATRTQLEYVGISGGLPAAPTNIVTYPAPLVDGDRFYVACNGSVLAVFKYLPYDPVLGVRTELIASISSAQNNTMVNCGLIVE